MGITLETTEPGDGKTFPKKGDTVHVHYRGTLEGGQVFDSSYDRGKVFATKIGVGRVIKGWDEGVLRMSVGEKAILKTPSSYAYGVRGFPPFIPPDADLTFEMHLISIS